MLSLLLFACANKAPTAEITEAPAAEPASAMRAELVVEGKLDERISTEPAELVLFYGGEHKGSMETCGCPKRPRGSLPRLMSYLEASRGANPDVPDVLLHGGYWLEDAMGLDGGLRKDVPVMNQWMLQGMEALDVDVANLSFQDLPGIDPLDELPDWAVSANVTASHGAPAPQPWRVLDRGGVKVGVTAITQQGMTFVMTPDYAVTDPLEGGRAALEAMKSEADVLVLMAFQAPEAAKALAEEFPELDIVIDVNMHREFYEPFTINNAVWVRSHYQTQRLGELRLRLDGGDIVGVLDRKIDLDPQVPDQSELMALVKAARKELAAVQEELYGP